MASSNASALALLATASVSFAFSQTASALEIINLRSGQVGGNPGSVGQLDDIVTYLPNNPPGAAISATAFTALDYAGAVSGPAAVVIQPHSAWSPNISDPNARWINWSLLPGTTLGAPGSALYAIPFVVTTASATSASISLEYLVDDHLGDWASSGGNPDGVYVNGVATGHQGFGFVVPTIFNGTVAVSTGLNYLYLYQRDVGATVSGVIFSAHIVVPAPGAAALGSLGLLTAATRRRR